MTRSALWDSPWPAEDAGSQRRSTPHDQEGLEKSLGLHLTAPLVASSRDILVLTMAILRDPGELFVVGHSGPPDATSFVEQLDPSSLETVRRSQDLAGGPVWPGGIAAHANGSLYVVFGNHAHRLSASLETLCSVELPRDRPYNSFVILETGHLVTKDFAGPFHGHDPDDTRTSQLLVLDPNDLSIISTLDLSEPSVARLSAIENEIVVVGTTSLLTVVFENDALRETGSVPYRSEPGQGCGWDAVLDGDLTYFLDNGDGTDRFDGSFEGRGIGTVPLRLHRINRNNSASSSVEVSGRLGGIIANPPALDATRRIVVGFDSGNGVIAAFHADTLAPLWTAELNHASHVLHDDVSGHMILTHYDRTRAVEEVVILETETGREVNRIATGSPVQSVVFPCAGFNNDFYLVSFTTITRISNS